MEVSYETKVILDSLDKGSEGKYQTVLLCNTIESIYFSRDAREYYDVLSGKKKQEVDNVIKTAFGNIPKFPKNKRSVYRYNDLLTVFSPVGKYIFSYDEPKLEWEILNETKNIQGFKCRLAKTQTDTGTEFFAWYTDDIAITDGPFRFKGLSGLILEVYNKNKTIEIYATEIKKSDELIEPVSYLDIIKTKNKKQYLEARKNYIENPSAYNGNIRIFDANGKETTNKIRDRLQKVNVFMD